MMVSIKEKLKSIRGPLATIKKAYIYKTLGRCKQWLGVALFLAYELFYL